MKIIVISLCVVLLSGCATHIADKIHPDIGFRPNPNIVLRELDSRLDVQNVCAQQHGIPGWYYGCAFVPYDSSQPCVITVLKGDDKTRSHEMMHCHGFMDEWVLFFKGL